MSTTKELGARVRELRTQRGWRQKELATEADTSVQTISEVELGRRNPGPALAHRLDRALGARGSIVSLLRDIKVPRQEAEHGDIRVRAHLFYPVAVNSSPVPSVAGALPLSAQVFGDGIGHELHLYDFGVAVAYERHDLVVACLADLADWRADQVRRRDTVASECLREHDLPPASSTDPYCLAIFETSQGPWEDEATRDRATRLMSCLSLLLRAEDRFEHEREMLEARGEILDTVSFGLPGSHHGWASWSGVAVFPRPSALELATRLVAVELWVQAVWCYADRVAETGQAASPERGVRFLRAVRRNLAAPGSTEHLWERLLREAVVETSRVLSKVDFAIEALTE